MLACHVSSSGNIFNPLNAELNPIFHLLALLGAHHILHVSRIRVNSSGTEYTATPPSKAKEGIPFLLIF